MEEIEVAFPIERGECDAVQDPGNDFVRQGRNLALRSVHGAPSVDLKWSEMLPFPFPFSAVENGPMLQRCASSSRPPLWTRFANPSPLGPPSVRALYQASSDNQQAGALDNPRADRAQGVQHHTHPEHRCVNRAEMHRVGSVGEVCSGSLGKGSRASDMESGGCCSVQIEGLRPAPVPGSSFREDEPIEGDAIRGNEGQAR